MNLYTLILAILSDGWYQSGPSARPHVVVAGNRGRSAVSSRMPRGAVRTLSAAACERMTRPADTEPCTANNCPTWITSPWGKVPMSQTMCMKHTTEWNALFRLNSTFLHFSVQGGVWGPTTTVQKRSVICQHANGSSFTDCDLRDRYTLSNTMKILWQYISGCFFS